MTMAGVTHPVLYEVDTRIWLNEMARSLGLDPSQAGTLDRVPDAALDRLADLGFTWLWLMGVWQTGPAGRMVSLSQPTWMAGYRRLLPDLTDADVSTSPFAVQAYTVHSDFGGDAALLDLRERLARRGVRLMLDFVPNHTGLDHPWVVDHPEYYVSGTEDDLARNPSSFVRVQTARGPAILAHGRDPYFLGWQDTLQLNHRHPALRAAMIGELRRVARLCDGVRCDMSMLILPDVITETWGNATLPADGSPPVDDPFWPAAIAAVRQEAPGFVFLAEVYWDREWELQQQGFDYTYDKTLYDRLRDGNARGVREHLHASLEYLSRSVHFLENHDEERAASTFAPGVHRAAAIVAFLAPGLRLLHEGQIKGRKARASVHLSRRPDEPADPALRAFYLGLLDCLKRPELHEGRWRALGPRQAWDGNPTWERFIAFSWDGPPGRRLLVAVNYGPTQGQCVLGLPFDDLAGRTVVLRDLMGPASFTRSGDELAARGLYLDVPAWGYHVFEWTDPETAG